MTNKAAAPFFDPVTMCVIELTAVAKPRDPGAFVNLLQRFTEAVAREVLEHEDEIRLRLGMPRRVVTAADVAGTDALLAELGVIDDTQQRSMGAAAVVPAAQTTTTETAARETPAAPSTSNATSEPQQSPGAALSEVSRSYTADNDRSKAVAADETSRAPGSQPLAELDSTRDATIAAPASSQSAAPLSESTADDDAGTSPAGPDAGAEASQPRLRRTAEQAAALRESIIRDYLAALAANDGLLPSGWVVNKAREVGVSNVSIYRAISAAPRKQAPAPVANGHAAPSRPGVREHTRKADCWCRRLPANQWCTATTLPAALSTPRPRADRYKPVRF